MKVRELMDIIPPSQEIRIYDCTSNVVYEGERSEFESVNDSMWIRECNIDKIGSGEWYTIVIKCK